MDVASFKEKYKRCSITALLGTNDGKTFTKEFYNEVELGTYAKANDAVIFMKVENVQSEATNFKAGDKVIKDGEKLVVLKRLSDAKGTDWYTIQRQNGQKTDVPGSLLRTGKKESLFNGFKEADANYNGWTIDLDPQSSRIWAWEADNGNQHISDLQGGELGSRTQAIEQIKDWIDMFEKGQASRLKQMGLKVRESFSSKNVQSEGLKHFRIKTSDGKTHQIQADSENDAVKVMGNPKYMNPAMTGKPNTRTYKPNEIVSVKQENVKSEGIHDDFDKLQKTIKQLFPNFRDLNKIHRLLEQGEYNLPYLIGGLSNSNASVSEKKLINQIISLAKDYIRKHVKKESIKSESDSSKNFECSDCNTNFNENIWKRGVSPERCPQCKSVNLKYLNSESVKKEELIIKDTGKKDRWGRPVYKDKSGKVYVDIELGKSQKPEIYKVTSQGEPDVPLRNFKIESLSNKNTKSEAAPGSRMVGGQKFVLARGIWSNTTTLAKKNLMKRLGFTEPQITNYATRTFDNLPSDLKNKLDGMSESLHSKLEKLKETLKREGADATKINPKDARRGDDARIKSKNLMGPIVDRKGNTLIVRTRNGKQEVDISDVEVFRSESIKPSRLSQLRERLMKETGFGAPKFKDTKVNPEATDFTQGPNLKKKSDWLIMSYDDRTKALKGIGLSEADALNWAKADFASLPTQYQVRLVK